MSKERQNSKEEILFKFCFSEYTPAQVCAELGLCNEAENEPIQNNVITRFSPKMEEEKDAGPLCVLCEFAMHILEKELLLTNRTLDMAEHAIEMLCSYMPDSIGDKCIDFVQVS